MSSTIPIRTLVHEDNNRNSPVMRCSCDRVRENLTGNDDGLSTSTDPLSLSTSLRAGVLNRRHAHDPSIKILGGSLCSTDRSARSVRTLDFLTVPCNQGFFSGLLRDFLFATLHRRRAFCQDAFFSSVSGSCSGALCFFDSTLRFARESVLSSLNTAHDFFVLQLRGLYRACVNHSVLWRKVNGKRNGDWNFHPARTTREHGPSDRAEVHRPRQLVLGGFWQQCQNEKFSLIDLDAEMQTGRKGSNAHRDRLSERTSLADGAIVGSCGNRNRKSVAEMTTPCFA